MPDSPSTVPAERAGATSSTGSRPAPEAGNPTYRRILSLTGPVLPACSLLARLPQAMSQIGVLLLMDATEGSLGAAGLVTGALALGQAAGGPFIGRLTDRRGQRAVAATASLANAVCLVLLVLAAANSAPLWVSAIAAAATGLTVPPIGPLARTRWVHLLRRAERPATETGTAFSLEGALDELSFVAGPALVGVIAAAVGPTAALVLAAVLVGVCGTAFALHRTAPRGPVVFSTPDAPAEGGAAPAVPERGADRPLFANPRLLVLLAAMVLQGVVFASVQSGVTALAGAEGRAGLAGLLYATMGVTSAAAGLGTAALPRRFGLPLRLRLTTAAMFVLTLPLILLMHGIVASLIVLPILGITVGPYMITVFSLAERAVRPDRLATAMGALSSGIVIGYALGSSLAGRFADAHGPTAAFLVTGAAALIACLLALVTAGRRGGQPAG